MASTLLEEFKQALENGNEARALELIQQPDFPLDEKDDWQCTPLHLACESGAEEVALALIKKGVPLDGKDKWQCTPARVFR